MDKRILSIAVRASIILSVLAVVTLFGSYYWFVVAHPGEAIEQGNIDDILAMESPVFYNDGTAKIGVFFQESHRQYVPYGRIPKFFVNAIVSSEDNKFFSHFGIDVLGITRAVLVNIKAGRWVQGGSTITQQTAKNLFKRKGRSLGEKLKELLYALRLEYHYPKEKILEFYANQFYVSGNGRGLGVAARYYFDKEVEQLSLVEAAFIAGSVKKPNYYNPHIKNDKERADKARLDSRKRTAYVLGQMYKLRYIDANTYQQALNEEIPFKQGRTRYSTNTVMDLVKDALADPIIEAAFAEYGIENIATSGIRVITTVDKDLQESSLYALKSELSRLDILLGGYDRKELQKLYAEKSIAHSQKLDIGQFLFVKVDKIHRDPLQVQVSFGKEGDPKAMGVIDLEGMQTALAALVHHKRQRWSEPVAGDIKLLLDEIEVGDTLYVSVREVDQLAGGSLFHLEKYPEVQGAVISLQKGKVKSMVGGMTNHYFNRAVTAKRNMGSTIKPLVYAAAIQLGWNTLDVLNNERNMFIFHDKPYFPRPDHDSPHSGVSMSWAGVHSENLATVWLVDHLCDQLTPGQFKEVIARLGLGQGPVESYNHYMRRVRDDMGIVVDEEAILQLAFERGRLNIETDLVFGGKETELSVLKDYHYSKGYDLAIDEAEEGEVEDEETKLRNRLASRSFLRLVELHDLLLRFEMFPDATLGQHIPNLYYLPQGSQSGSTVTRDLSQYIFIFSDTPHPSWRPVTNQIFSETVDGLSPEQQKDFWRRVRLDNQLTVETVEQVRRAMDVEYDKIARLKPYSPEVLHSLRDFRMTVGLQYIIGLCRALGVESDLDAVLSFPLGSNVISLTELAKIYEGLTSGMAYSTVGQLDIGVGLIEMIESNEGEVIYRADTRKKMVIDPQTSLAVNDILRNVVKFGTGRYAYRNIHLHSRDPELEEGLLAMDITVPALGKTGTANRFTNASFAGFIPGAHQGEGSGVSMANGLVLAAYVGYDDNKPMVRHTTHISGSSGALPVWTQVAADYILNRDYAKVLDLADLSFSGVKELPLFYPELGQIAVPVSVRGGGVVARGGVDSRVMQTPIVTFGEISPNGEIKLQRYFRPYWSH
ncbi:MAG: transglycosylase domain-containing protein [Desulfobulbaceae bacterium]|jgi:penicillin-binding protein 1A|nr:transglycosylase domain-containing protein [Desulfobulbaceae bacterium]